MRLRYTFRANADLTAISEYLLSRNPQAAGSFGESIRKTARLLLEFPASGRTLSRRRNVRVIPLSDYPYLIFYTANSEELRILHIRHGARRPVRADEL